MMNLYKKLLILFLLGLTQNIIALDVKITSKSVEGYFKVEDNKNFGFFGDSSVMGELELNNKYKIRSGLSLGRLDGNADLKTFLSLNASPFSQVPLDFSLLWNYNGLFEYELHAHSIFPMLTYHWKTTGLSFGYNFRFSSFFGEKSIMEATPVFSLYINFISNDILRFAFIWGNYNELGARNFIDYTNNFTLWVNISDNMQLINSIQFLQSGAFSFVESLYGVSFKTGVRYSW